jgi:lauroyl/myristoyl acyltransferase
MARVPAHPDIRRTHVTFRHIAPSDDPATPVRNHPVVVSGTYDDHNWQVLKERWMELRAQLHGEVLPHQGTHAAISPELEALRNRIIVATPNFAPWE